MSIFAVQSTRFDSVVVSAHSSPSVPSPSSQPLIVIHTSVIGLRRVVAVVFSHFPRGRLVHHHHTHTHTNVTRTVRSRHGSRSVSVQSDVGSRNDYPTAFLSARHALKHGQLALPNVYALSRCNFLPRFLFHSETGYSDISFRSYISFEN